MRVWQDKGPVTVHRYGPEGISTFVVIQGMCALVGLARVLGNRFTRPCLTTILLHRLWLLGVIYSCVESEHSGVLDLHQKKGPLDRGNRIQ